MPRSPGATGAPTRSEQALGGRRAAAREAAGVADQDEHVARAELRDRLADEAVHEAVLLAHRGELGVEAGEVARRRLAQLLHGDDVEAGQVDRLEVGRRVGAQRARGGEVEAVEAPGALRLGRVEQRPQPIEGLGGVHLAVGRPALLQLEGGAVGHEVAVDRVGRPGRPPVDDADAQALLRGHVPERLDAAQRRRSAAAAG